MRGKKDDSNPVTCQACHGQKPHKPSAAKLNDHTDRVACQTCHIPRYARGGVPTKLAWDWSTAGQRGPDGKPLIRKNAEGHIVYIGTKGDFEVGENLTPDYIWFNGTVRYHAGRRKDRVEWPARSDRPLQKEARTMADH